MLFILHVSHCVLHICTVYICLEPLLYMCILQNICGRDLFLVHSPGVYVWVMKNGMHWTVVCVTLSSPSIHQWTYPLSLVSWIEAGPHQSHSHLRNGVEG